MCNSQVSLKIFQATLLTHVYMQHLSLNSVVLYYVYMNLMLLNKVNGQPGDRYQWLTSTHHYKIATHMHTPQTMLTKTLEASDTINC